MATALSEILDGFEPTYEGLKLFRPALRAVAEAGFEPTYEGLKREHIKVYAGFVDRF